MSDTTSTQAVGPYTLPPLPYDYAALEPVIDAATMKLHHDMHHKAYVDALNKALEQHPEWLGKTIVDLMRQLDHLPDDIRQTVRNNGGGHINHSFFWQVLAPPSAGAQPSGALVDLINRDFGSMDTFKTSFQDAGVKQFGSGWVFLTVDPSQDHKLAIKSTPNQDSLLQSTTPAVLACDVWEHAYYLKYNNRRAEWLKSWWDVVNWGFATQSLNQATKTQ